MFRVTEHKMPPKGLPKYQRTSTRNSWSETSMAEAVRAVLDGSMGFKRAADSHGVPKSTLERKVKKARTNSLTPEVAAVKKLGRYETVFNAEQEKQLVEHVLVLEERLFGITLTDIRMLAFELAERNNIEHNFNRDKRMAGKCWLYSFLSRNKKLSLRDPESTSIARAKGFNRVAVKKFFDLLGSLINKHKFTPNNIYNVDETGILTVPNKPSKVLALRGKKQVGCLSSAERGVLVTVETCISAAGVFVPPMFVFPRVKENPRLMDDAFPGSFAVYHKTGWITKETFIVWFKKFIDFSNPTPEKPVLLLLDGHNSHTKSLELINVARENNVIILTFPPHTTHRLQPLDVTFMSPLSTYYEQEVRKWLFNHPGRCVTIFEIAKLFKAAYSRAAVAETAVKGFSQTGICPYNPDVFPDHLFAPSETTDHQMTDVPNTDPSRQNESSSQISSANTSEVSQCQQELTSNLLQELPANELQKNAIKDLKQPTTFSSFSVRENQPPKPSEDFLRPDQPSISSGEKGLELICYRPKLPFSISPKCVLPVPEVQGPRPEKKVDKRKGKTAILTSSPYKNELEMEEKEKMTKEQERIKKQKENDARKSMLKSKKIKIVKKVNGKEGKKRFLVNSNLKVQKTLRKLLNLLLKVNTEIILHRRQLAAKNECLRQKMSQKGKKNAFFVMHYTSIRRPVKVGFNVQDAKGGLMKRVPKQKKTTTTFYVTFVLL